MGTRVAVVLVGAAASLVLVLVAVSVGAQQEGNCTQVASFGPETENQITPPFQISGNTFRISGEARLPEPTLGASVLIAALDESGTPVDTVSVSQPGPFSQNILEGPGTFSLEIETIGQPGQVEYTVRVEDCQSSPTKGPATTQPKTAPQPKGAPSPPPKAAPPPSPTPPPQPTPQPKTPSTNLKSGGPSAGPVPQMPGGRCPKEFPVQFGKACYR